MGRLKPIEQLAGDVRKKDLVRIKLTGVDIPSINYSDTSKNEYVGYFCKKQEDSDSLIFSDLRNPTPQITPIEFNPSTKKLKRGREELKASSYEILRRS